LERPPSGKLEFEACYSRALKSTQHFQLWCKLWLLIFFLLLCLLILDIINVTDGKQPISVDIILVLANESDADINSEFLIGTTSAFLITAIVPYLFGKLLNDALTVATAIQIKNNLRLGVLIQLLVTITAGVGTAISLSSISLRMGMIGAAFNIVSGLMVNFVGVMTFRAADKCTRAMIEFNEFLIRYR